MKLFFDTEFLDRGPNDLHLISLGIVAEDGREYYAETPEAVSFASSSYWLRENVLPHLDGLNIRSRPEMAMDLIKFTRGSNTRFWGWFADWDWVLVCYLYGGMLDCPLGHRANDVAQEAERLGVRLTTRTPRHKAIECARWTKQAYEICVAAEQAQQVDRSL